MSNVTYQEGKTVTIVLPDTEVQGTFAPLEGGGQGLNVEGTLLEYVTDEIPCGLRASDDDSKAKLDELRQRGKVMTQASAVPVELRE